MTRVRCAIYTRKSTDEGLEQEFNSLDAQYEACKAYVASQRHEGWALGRERYDDGGFSGGTMERPGLKALLADVEAGRVDVVVIYKIDRLTRSLADFARIVERLEQAGASFVSVTQSFNTKTSMGRLMLHVLLSFAQFEREVGAERVRDKIAASKAKGMWMGGTLPLGYDAVDRKLVINPVEAETVQMLFQEFAKTKSISATLAWARRQGLRTKLRSRDGKPVGGNLYTDGALRCLLANRLYGGEVEHNGNIYPGQHDAIVERQLFDKVHMILAELGNDRLRGKKIRSESLLMGLVADCHGRSMGPVHTTRSGQRFRYYVTHGKAIDEHDPAPYRLPAKELEAHVCTILGQHLATKVTSVDGDAEVKRVARLLRDGTPGERRAIILDNVKAIIVGDAQLTIELADGSSLARRVERIRHGNDARLVIGPASNDGPKANPQLLVLLKDIQRAHALALSKPRLSLDRLAQRFGRSTERYKRLLRLNALSPTIVMAILEGKQPPHITNRFLQTLDRLPLSWAEKEQMLLG